MADDQETQEETEDRAEEQTSGAAERAREKEDAWEKAREKMTKMEEEDDPPSDLKDWPDDEAKYVTYGGGEGDHGYDEGPEKKLGPSSLERFEDGSITIEGEEVENPEEHRMEEPVQAAVQSLSDRREEEDQEEGDDDGDDDDRDSGDDDGGGDDDDPKSEEDES